MKKEIGSHQQVIKLRKTRNTRKSDREGFVYSVYFVVDKILTLNAGDSLGIQPGTSRN